MDVEVKIATNTINSETRDKSSEIMSETDIRVDENASRTQISRRFNSWITFILQFLSFFRIDSRRIAVKDGWCKLSFAQRHNNELKMILASAKLKRRERVIGFPMMNE